MKICNLQYVLISKGYKYVPIIPTKIVSVHSCNPKAIANQMCLLPNKFNLHLLFCVQFYVASNLKLIKIELSLPLFVVCTI